MLRILYYVLLAVVCWWSFNMIMYLRYVNKRKKGTARGVPEQLPILLDLLRWLAIDIYRVLRYGRDLRIYGIWLVVGLYGQGKTMFLTWYLNRQRAIHGDKILIYTNYYYKHQDGHIAHWRDLLKEYDKPVIFAYDEIQNDFNSRDYQNFPVELLTLLTQNRKGKGKQIIGTAQRYTRVDKVFRELCQYVVECHTILGRLTSVRAYDWEDYEQYIHQTEVSKKMRIRKRWGKRFVQDDYVRTCYDSYQTLESAKSKEYQSRQEVVQLL